MQIPSKSEDEFIKSVGAKAEKIRSAFLENITKLTKTVLLKVMLGDSTVTEQQTFDPARVRKFYEDVLKKLQDWRSEGISVSNDKDLRRIFIKYDTRDGNYLLSCHMSLQYHALLYYKTDHRVVDIQKILADITDKINIVKTDIAPKGDLLIQEKLKELGYEGLDEQKLFEIFFKNETLTKEMSDKVNTMSDENIEQLTKKQSQLFKELDNLLLEIYHTTPVMIDEMRMIAAEEGCICNFDLEYIKNKTKEGSFDPRRIPSKVKDDLLKRMDQIFNAMH